ncbi:MULTISPECIES: hypothetical protein [Streptomycetaceae]|uniref:hypothetical protein n=1 Tax=Streptomycetaceae TaxID=2062 RepID=UPI00300B39A1
MTTDNQQTESTDPVPPTAPTAAAVDPDNWHTEGTTEDAVDGLLADESTPKKPALVKPNNWHTESEPAN